MFRFRRSFALFSNVQDGLVLALARHGSFDELAVDVLTVGRSSAIG